MSFSIMDSKNNRGVSIHAFSWSMFRLQDQIWMMKQMKLKIS